MFNISRGFFLLLLLFSSNILLAQDLQTIIDSAPNQEAFWSVTVRDGEGNILENVNSDKLIIPASNQKLFTTAAVLDGLGSDFKYTTNVYGEGALVDSVWEGYFIIKAVGDPSISGIMYNGDRYHVFKSFLDQFHKKGIHDYSGGRNYDGGYKVDANYFDDQVYPKGWDWDDLSFYYGVEIHALSFNNNAVDIEVFADSSVGKRPRVEHFPNTWRIQTGENIDDIYFLKPVIQLLNRQEIIPENLEYDEYYRRELGSNQIVLGSKLPKGYYEKESLSIQDAETFFIDSFDEFLKQNGFNKDYYFYDEEYLIEGDYDYINNPIIASHTSEPLSKLVEWTNKESDNFYTEMLLKTLAAEKAGIPGTFENGIKEVRNFLGRMEIDTTFVIMKDGSGMASGNFTKTAILSEFLVKMQDHPEFSSFYNSMSIAGIDGTIAHRMKGTPLYNNFKGKSGYVGGVRTLSGYFTTASGKKLIVSLAVNNFIGKVRPIDAIHEQILEYLYAKY
ncbi:MAG: D-alanyl-D-alanine carboxypeptidase/D-alanyl-D-alanine-endopeptidase [Balneolaceae bacterium]